MAVPFWQPGELIQPGDIRRPTSAGAVTQQQPDNGDFEAGNTGWTFAGSGSHTIDGVRPVFQGAAALHLGWTDNPNGQTLTATNDARLPVEPGTLITLRAVAYAQPIGGDVSRLQLRIQWYSASGAPMTSADLALDPTPVQGHPRINHQGLGATAAQGIWVPLETRGIAPAGGAQFTVVLIGAWGDRAWSIDDVHVVYAQQQQPNRLLFRAVQAASGFTGQSEPDWPSEIGQTVQDNQVTWEGVTPDNVTWEARRILVSGGTEPTWPTTVNASVVDSTIAWVLDPRRVSDERLPQTSKLAAIAASKVFTADDDIVPFSATTNPLDWSAPEDAGYLPFGLQTYGANPITALGLYRGNLVVSNSVGTQIWQVDPDPTAMALLDAIPIGCTFPKTMQPVGNDLAFLTEVGIRNMGTVGAAVNLQAGYFGKPIDELVIEAVKAARAAGREPISTYWPAQGQYWVIFGSEAFVLTVNDGRDGRSWSRYVFPAEIDYATVLGEDLYLRAGDLVWRVDESATLDDQQDEDVGTEFAMVLQWPHLDLGALGQEKQLVGVDLVGSGDVSVSIGYDQRSPEFDADAGPWTPSYDVGDADTLQGGIIPLPVAGPSFALRLAFTGGTEREFIAANIYVNDMRVPR